MTEKEVKALKNKHWGALNRLKKLRAALKLKDAEIKTLQARLRQRAPSAGLPVGEQNGL